MIRQYQPEVCDPNIPGCELQLPLFTKEERTKITNMIDHPSEYTDADFRAALDLMLQRSTEAEAFTRNLYLYFLRMKGVWSRWLPALKPSFKVAK